MDGKTIRKYFFARFAGRNIEFTTLDGKNYGGLLENWLDDGTLLLNKPKAYDAEGELLEETHMYSEWVLFNFDQILLLYVSDEMGIPDELVNTSLAIRRKKEQEDADEKRKEKLRKWEL
jgi:hypothetical protein